MTKKSAARLQRDAFKKDQAKIQQETSTLWQDVKATSKMCWEMLSKNRLVLTTLQSGIVEFIPKEQIGVLNALITSITNDLAMFKSQLEEVDAKHANYTDSNEPVDDQDKIIAMFSLAIECQNKYGQIVEQYESVVVPDVNRVTEIIALGEEAFIKYVQENEGKTYTARDGTQYRITNGELHLDDSNSITDVEIIEKEVQ